MAQYDNLLVLESMINNLMNVTLGTTFHQQAQAVKTAFLKVVEEETNAPSIMRLYNDDLDRALFDSEDDLIGDEYPHVEVTPYQKIVIAEYIRDMGISGDDFDNAIRDGYDKATKTIINIQE